MAMTEDDCSGGGGAGETMYTGDVCVQCSVMAAQQLTMFREPRLAAIECHHCNASFCMAHVAAANVNDPSSYYCERCAVDRPWVRIVQKASPSVVAATAAYMVEEPPDAPTTPCVMCVRTCQKTVRPAMRGCHRCRAALCFGHLVFRRIDQADVYLCETCTNITHGAAADVHSVQTSTSPTTALRLQDMMTIMF